MNLKPIKPFEPILSETIPEDDDWISQIKWDGVRVLTYYDGEKTTLYNRKLNERTNIFPELLKIEDYADCQSVILDGEVIALDHNGKPSFHEVMKRDAVKHPEKVKELMEAVPISYMIFDIIFYNGEWIHQYPLQERMELLNSIIHPNEYVQLVPTYTDGKSLFEIVKQYDLEGIVCKDMNSNYHINGKNGNWKKIKNYKDLIAIICGVTYRSGIVNAMLLGLYNDDHQLTYIGDVGTGKLTKDEWKYFTEIINPLKSDTMPFVNLGKNINHVQWLRPILTVKIQYMEWTAGLSLRQPSIQAFVDYDPQDCKLNQ
ncbi:RNA ligase family protein [Heyndrickxia ginsengihumi]|uniref:ATP-dependent DNA ligase n=1 Tax=Heyndrickxia ginsengihumi TaxID=363870 RepID=UPI000471C5D9|nr:RNA ligase family protein [Heyndrickxia ginsengihumi]